MRAMRMKSRAMRYVFGDVFDTDSVVNDSGTSHQLLQPAQQIL